MAKNKLSDLNDHLFAQIERLTEEEISPEQIDAEVKRSVALCGLGNQVVQVHRLAIDSVRIISSGEVPLLEVFDRKSTKK